MAMTVRVTKIDGTTTENEVRFGELKTVASHGGSPATVASRSFGSHFYLPDGRLGWTVAEEAPSGKGKPLQPMAFPVCPRRKARPQVSVMMAPTSFPEMAPTRSRTSAAAAMGSTCLPEMERYKYSRRLAAGTVAMGGVLGPLIPPSLFMILIGAITGEFVGADKGLGYLLLVANGNLDTRLLFADIFVLSFFGILLFNMDSDTQSPSSAFRMALVNLIMGRSTNLKKNNPSTVDRNPMVKMARMIEWTLIFEIIWSIPFKE
jgi:hypothetical protein